MPLTLLSPCWKVTISDAQIQLDSTTVHVVAPDLEQPVEHASMTVDPVYMLLQHVHTADPLMNTISSARNEYVPLAGRPLCVF